MKAVIIKAQNTSDLIKRSVVLYARRYKPSETRWVAELRTGWGSERKLLLNLSRQQARQLTANFLGE